MKVKITENPQRVSVLCLCLSGRGGLHFISRLYLESLWTAAADGLRPDTEARLIQSIPVKDILIFLSCQVGAPSCSGKRFSSSFQSLQHSEGGSWDCHRSSWNTFPETNQQNEQHKLYSHHSGKAEVKNHVPSLLNTAKLFRFTANNLFTLFPLSLFNF